MLKHIKHNPNGYGLKWHTAYIIILVLRGIATIPSFTNYYTIFLEYKTVTLWFVACVLVDFSRVLLDFIVAHKLRKFQEDAYAWNNALLCISILTAFITGMGNATEGQSPLTMGLLTALIWGLILLPIFIYYRKRRSLFGYTAIERFETKAAEEQVSTSSEPLYTPPTDVEGNNVVDEVGSVMEKGHELLLQNEHTDENIIQKSLFCRKCGAALLENASFCNKCGTEVLETTE